MAEFKTLDSGQRAEFASGMRRDTDDGKARFELMVPVGIPYRDQMLTRFAELMSRGAAKYSVRNWELASTQEELDRFRSSAFRHFMQWLSGETDEDHAAAVLFNVLAAETTQYKMECANEVGSRSTEQDDGGEGSSRASKDDDAQQARIDRYHGGDQEAAQACPLCRT